MIKILLISIGILCSVVAQAHVEEGTWAGKTSTQQDCSFVAKAQYFENNLAHPLNEKIPVQIGNDTFIVGHPPVLDVKSSTVFFNHDLFQAIIATPTGAKALVIDMTHSEAFEGPTGFTLIENNWKTGEKTTLRCENIQHVAERK